MESKQRNQDNLQREAEGRRRVVVQGSDSEELRDILIAVYGTLKRGFGNNVLLSNAVYVSNAKTERQYPMVVHGSGLPFLVEKPGVGFNVDVELYLVSEDELKQLDMLEGHPDWYKRKKRGAVTPEGETLLPYIYFAPDEYYHKSETLHECY